MNLQLQAKSRLQAAPVGYVARQRLIKQIMERSPTLQELGKVSDRGVWYANAAGKDLKPVLEALKALGWSRVSTNEKTGAGPSMVLTRADKTWPLIVKIDHFSGKPMIDVDSRDVEGEGWDVDNAGLEAIAKKLLPTNREGTMWRKYGGHQGDNTLKVIRQRALDMGFKPFESANTGSPDGSYMGSGSVYEKDGVFLHLSSNYGSVAAQNSFGASLSYDPHRKAPLKASAASDKIFELYISYEDPRSGGDLASARIKIPHCMDAEQAKRVFKKEKGHKFPKYKIVRCVEVGPPTKLNMSLIVAALSADLKNAITRIAIYNLKSPTPVSKVTELVLKDPRVKALMKGVDPDLVKTYVSKVWDEFESAVGN